MDLFRIGDKIVDIRKVNRTTEKILTLRSQGLSQKDVAERLKLDRTFISRLEALGEVRKGRKLGMIGFPLRNKEEITRLAEEAGFDYTLLMSDKERWYFVKDRSGMEFFNEIMGVISRLRECDTIIILGSSKWIKLAEGLFDSQVFHIEIGDTPIEKDIYLDPIVFKDLLEKVLPERRVL